MAWFKVGLAPMLCAGVVMASHAGSSSMMAAPLQGQWAGDQARFVMDTQGGTVELECATGTIAGPVTPGGDGKFTATGTFEQHQGGATRADGPAPAKARYSGEVQGGSLKLTVLVDGNAVPKVFNLREGARIKLIRCL